MRLSDYRILKQVSFFPKKSQVVHHQVSGADSASTGSDGGVGSRVKRSDIDFDAFRDAKRRKAEKGGKGHRHFSMKVCEKVQAKGSTSYNEVADELVLTGFTFSLDVQ